MSHAKWQISCLGLNVLIYSVQSTESCIAIGQACDNVILQ